MKRKNIPEGKHDYDFEEDSYYTLMKQRTYDSSFQLGSFIFDLDGDGNIVGLEILNASKVFRMPKYFLQNVVSGKVHIHSDESLMRVDFSLDISVRNKERSNRIYFEQVNQAGITSEMEMVI